MSETKTRTRGRYVNAKQLAIYEAADEFAGTIILMMGLGLLENLDITTAEGKQSREMLGNSLAAWADLSLPGDNDEA